VGVTRYSRSKLYERLWRRRRRGMLSNKYSSLRPRWRVIRGFQQDASCSKVHWRSEMRRGPFGREAAVRCAASEVPLRRRLQRAKREGDIPRNADPTELDRYVINLEGRRSTWQIWGHGFCDLSLLDDCCASNRSQRLTLQAAPMNWFCKSTWALPR
jgi:hypothetical protein